MTEPSAQRVAGKRAFVTGAAGGLGAAIARMLARHGANVFSPISTKRRARRG
jgi:NAD(P)-dependent dehydrogenase (short-subunit alcohol dehydrogenase family)